MGLVTFTDESSSSTGISEWLWDFGDGHSSSEQNPLHMYIDNSTYTVCLTVIDNNDCCDTYCDDLTITTIDHCACSPNDPEICVNGSQNTTQQLEINGEIQEINGRYEGYTIIVDANQVLALNTGVEFYDCLFLMGEDSRIFIPQGFTQDFTDCTFMSCDDTWWDGIYNFGNSSFTLNSIYHARDALWSFGNALQPTGLNVNNNCFIDNEIGLRVEDEDVNLSICFGNTFEAPARLSEAGILLNDQALWSFDNTFRNVANGIIASNSVSLVTLNTFQNILISRSNGSQVSEGVAIFSTGNGYCQLNSSSIESSDFGVRIIRGGALIQDNPVIEVNLQAIQMLFNTQDCQIIENERIECVGAGSDFDLIQVFLARNNNVNIERNLLVAGSCASAIGVSRVNDIIIQRNFVDVTGSAKHGIRVDLSPTTTIDQNKIEGNSTNIGIELAASSSLFLNNGNVSCNCIESTEQSLFIPDQGLNYQITTNKFKAFTLHGLHYGSDATVGPQYDNGNTWLEIPDGVNALFENNDQDLIVSNLYSISPSIVDSQGQFYWPGPDPDFWEPDEWFVSLLTGTPASCSFDACAEITRENVTELEAGRTPPPGVEDIYDIEYKILADSFINSIYPASQWLAEMIIYEKAIVLPTVQSDPALNDLLNSPNYLSQREHSGLFAGLLRIDFFSGVNDLNLEIIDSLESGSSPSDIQLLMMERVDSLDVATNKDSLLLSGAESYISTIMADSLFEINHKYALISMIDIFQEDTLLESDLTTLKAVAEQCRMPGGRGVLVSRTLLDYLGVSYVIPPGCGQYRSIELDAEEKKEESLVTAYPNPSNGLVLFSNNSEQSKNCKILDVSGREHSTILLNPTSNTEVNLPQGMWFAVIRYNDRIEQTLKLVIVE
jgi:PKD repeat protein